jgi:hypothetical protein
MRETIGEIVCPYHDIEENADGDRTVERKAEVRRDKNGKLYYFCSAGCGPVHPHGWSFQVWIINNARLYGAKELHNGENTRANSRVQGKNGSGEGRKESFRLYVK